MSTFREGQLPLRAASKDYVNAAIANLNIGGAAQSSFLVSGGQIVWTSAYNFLVSAASYYIQGVLYSSPESTITLDAAHATLDRIDVIAVDSSGAVVKVTGTAAAQPSEPDIDPGTQLKLGIVFVAAASTQPTVSETVVYFENAGGPGEWNWTEVGTTFDPNSINNPKAPATKDIEGTSATAGDYAQGDIPSSTLDPNDQRLLILYIRSKAQWANNRGLSVSLRTGGVLKGQSININRSGSFGFDSSVTGVYQLIAIPIELFAIPIGTTITQLRITAFGNGHGFYIADITFQANGATQPPNGLTQEQADALYVRKDSSVLKYAVGITIDGSGSVLTTGVKGYKSIPVSGTITKARMLADQSGSVVIDVWKDTYANFPPTDADSITAAAPPTISAAQKSEDTTLTGWTKAVTAGDVLGFNIDSASTITRVTLELEIQP